MLKALKKNRREEFGSIEMKIVKALSYAFTVPSFVMCGYIFFSSRPQEGHDPGPEGNDDIPDLAIVKIEKVGEDETGGLLLQVDSGQGDAAHRHGQLSMEEEQEYDESDLTGDWSQEDISNEGSFQSSHMDDPTGAMYMGPTSGRFLYYFLIIY